MIHILNKSRGLTKLKSLLVLWLCLFCSFHLYGQKHHFSVHKGGKEIGEITATLKEFQNTQTYKIQSDVSFQVLWKRYRRKTNSTVTYRNESLETSYSGIYMNNEMVDSSTIKQDINDYHAFKFPDDRFVLENVDSEIHHGKTLFSGTAGSKKSVL